MRKSFLFLLVVAALISGCVTGSERSIRSEGILPTSAYVVGKSLAQDFQFRLAGESQYSLDTTKYFFINQGQYSVLKVLPGAYYATEASSYTGTVSAGGAPLFSIYLEPGKITYIGDLRLLVSGQASPPPPGQPDLYAGVQQKVSVTKEVQNNSEAARKAILETFPELAGKLDAVFVYRPAQ